MLIYRMLVIDLLVIVSALFPESAADETEGHHCWYHGEGCQCTATLHTAVSPRSVQGEKSTY